MAITLRNLQEDTQSVSAEVKGKFEQATGRPAPVWG